MNTRRELSTRFESASPGDVKIALLGSLPPSCVEARVLVEALETTSTDEQQGFESAVLALALLAS